MKFYDNNGGPLQSVEVTPILKSGKHIATIDNTKIFAPNVSGDVIVAESQGESSAVGFETIAYSEIGRDNKKAVNTAEHFVLAARMGFDALKADIQPTSDCKLICCHDKEFTLSGNNILAYSSGSSSNVAISSLTYDDVMNFEYDRGLYGYKAKVCSVETYLMICKKFGKKAFLTYRPYYNDNERVLAELVSIIDKVGCADLLTINMYTYSNTVASMLREALPNVKLNATFKISSGGLDISKIDEIAELKNVSISIYSSNPDVYRNSLEAISYAHSIGIKIGASVMSSLSELNMAMDCGCDCATIDKPLLDYQPKDYWFTLKVENNVASFGYRNLLGQSRDTLAALIEISGINIGISRIRSNENLIYDDVLATYWLDELPYTLDIDNGASIAYTNKKIVVSCDTSVSKIYNIHVRV